MKNTIKPLMFSNWSLEGLKDCYQMALAARDGDEESFLKGIPVDEATLAMEAIKEQGAGGSFIAHQHTLEHFRYIWHPRLFDRGNRESWEMAGSPDLGARLNQKVKEILKTHQPEPLSKSVKAQVSSILANAKAQYPSDK